jgi:hypothetical protein
MPVTAPLGEMNSQAVWVLLPVHAAKASAGGVAPPAREPVCLPISPAGVARGGLELPGSPDGGPAETRCGEQVICSCTISQTPVSAPFCHVNSQAAWVLLPVHAAMASAGAVPSPAREPVGPPFSPAGVVCGGPDLAGRADGVLGGSCRGEQASCACTISQRPVSTPFCHVNSQVAWAFLPVHAAMASAGGAPPSALPTDAVVSVRELEVCVTAAEAEIASAAGVVSVGVIATLDNAVVCVGEFEVSLTAAAAEVAWAAGGVTVGVVATVPPEQADSNMAMINIRYRILFFTLFSLFLA